jgi:hypothetical protein
MRRASQLTLVVALASFAQSACASHGWHRAGASADTSVGDVVSGTELVASGAPWLYEALIRTRHNYFSSRGLSSFANQPRDAILVFRGGALMGTSEVLRMIPAKDVRVVRRLSVIDTYHKYGRHVSIGGFEVEFVKEI